MRWAWLFLGLLGCEEVIDQAPAKTSADEIALGAWSGSDKTQRDAVWDVLLGYDRTATVLAPHGRWRKSKSRIVEWCPHRAFVPFREGGRWVEENGHLRWQANAGDWRDTTTHTGRWVLIESRDEWCWVPGVVHEDAPVVWRGGHGFIGWAPRPRVGAHLVDRAFTYVRESKLGSAPLEVLSGDLAAIAHAQTSYVTPPSELPRAEVALAPMPPLREEPKSPVKHGFVEMKEKAPPAAAPTQDEDAETTDDEHGAPLPVTDPPY